MWWFMAGRSLVAPSSKGEMKNYDEYDESEE